MALPALAYSNGPEQENPSSRVKGRAETDNRANSLVISHPRIESLKIFAGMASPNGTLMILADGKQQFFTINRRDLFGIAEQAFTGMKNMEPSKWEPGK